ncbi:hypothetical protein L1987_10915 [Smallanthus sonchifolius]|uniref:Uncharacterized protein n=1 Tax=Smallanthus sonchifolius TaxID=185202 RepID=A0ACB9JBP2_9ASTR|nr:hypothetical protein L1987_10915 [Smallanthus sonchifolius]
MLIASDDKKGQKCITTDVDLPYPYPIHFVHVTVVLQRLRSYPPISDPTDNPSSITVRESPSDLVLQIRGNRTD